MSSGFIMHVCIIICILIVFCYKTPNDGYVGDRNMLVKNKMWSNTFINVHLLVYHVSIKVI